MWWRLDETPYVTKKSRIQRNGCGRIGAVFVGHSLKESLHAEDETMRVTVEKLAATEQEGDWHDRPYRWVVKGPRIMDEQKFPTKKAEHYAKVRRNSDSQLQAIHSYAIGM